MNNITKTLFYNCKLRHGVDGIYSGSIDSDSAVLVEGNRIIRTGKSSEMSAVFADERIDLGGRTLYPGFIANHDHFYLNMIFQLNISCKEKYDFDINEFLDSLKKRIEREKKGKLLIGWGFADYKCKQRRFPTMDELDKVSPDNPLVIIHTSGHTVVLNSRAMEDTGIPLFNKKEGENEEDVVRDSAGKAVGLLHESTALKFSFGKMVENFEKYPENEKIDIVMKSVQSFNRIGLTTVVDPLCDMEIMKLYNRCEEKSGLDIRIIGFPEYLKCSEQLNSKTFPVYNSDRLITGPVKLLSDGSLSGRTAAVSFPYIGTDNYGVLCYKQDDLERITAELDGLGYTLAIHAIGDRGVEAVLLAYEKIIHDNNSKGHRIEHCGILNKKIIERLKSKNIFIAVQPGMLYEQGDGFIESCGHESLDRIYPYKSLISAGLKVGGSSDCPVINPSPVLGMKAAVTRQTEKGEILASSERLTAEEALYLYTMGAAETLKKEKEIGSIEAGKYADMTVLEEDLIALDTVKWNDDLVYMTIANGKIVYKKT